MHMSHLHWPSSIPRNKRSGLTNCNLLVSSDLFLSHEKSKHGFQSWHSIIPIQMQKLGGWRNPSTNRVHRSLTLTHSFRLLTQMKSPRSRMGMGYLDGLVLVTSCLLPFVSRKLCALFMLWERLALRGMYAIGLLLFFH